jgi:hypothetical protein
MKGDWTAFPFIHTKSSTIFSVCVDLHSYMFFVSTFIHLFILSLSGSTRISCFLTSLPFLAWFPTKMELAVYLNNIWYLMLHRGEILLQ